MMHQKLKELSNGLKELPDIRKEIKEKFCPKLKCEYYDLVIVVNPKYQKELGYHSFIKYDKYVDDLVFLDKNHLKI